MLLFDEAAQRELIRALGLPPTTDTKGLVDGLGQRFDSHFAFRISHFAIRQFADANKLPYEAEVDFSP